VLGFRIRELLPRIAADQLYYKKIGLGIFKSELSIAPATEDQRSDRKRGFSIFTSDLSIESSARKNSRVQWHRVVRGLAQGIVRRHYSAWMIQGLWRARAGGCINPELDIRQFVPFGIADLQRAEVNALRAQADALVLRSLKCVIGTGATRTRPGGRDQEEEEEEEER
jgi:hypothetical protein